MLYKLVSFLIRISLQISVFESFSCSRTILKDTEFIMDRVLNLISEYKANEFVTYHSIGTEAGPV
jgi:hypothetical protein